MVQFSIHKNRKKKTFSQWLQLQNLTSAIPSKLTFNQWTARRTCKLIFSNLEEEVKKKKLENWLEKKKFLISFSQSGFIASFR